MSWLDLERGKRYRGDVLARPREGGRGTRGDRVNG